MHAEEVEKHMFKFYFLQNGMAILNACTVLRDRLKPYRERMPGKGWDDWVGKAYFERVPLFASGFYATPGVGLELEFYVHIQGRSKGWVLGCVTPCLGLVWP